MKRTKLMMNCIDGRTTSTALLYGTITGVALLVAAEPVVAQSTSPPAPEATELTTITVTARRTEERLQDVPVAVQVFDANSLAERRIGSETDLQVATPGLTVRQTGSSDQLNYAIRGQSIDAFSFSSPAVVAYFNEVQTGGVAATSFFDLQSIQVLKGPQGTLFGRNATGGAVLYGAQKPTKEFGGYFKTGYGNYQNREVEVALNATLNDAIAVRVSGKSRQRRGFQHNLLSDTYVNSIDSQTGRLSLLIAPSDSGFENVIMFQRGIYGGYTGAVKMQNANGVNGTPATYFDPITGTTKPLITNFRDVYSAGVVSTDPRVNALFNGIADYLTKQKNIGFYDVYENSANIRDGKQTLITNTTTYDFTDATTIKNIFGYNKVVSKEQSDIDGSPYTFLQVGGGTTANNLGYTFGTKQWSDELQLSGKVGGFKYIIGAFVSKEETYNRIPLRVTGDLGAPFLGPYDFTITDKSKAVYGQVTYALTDRLNVSGGIRYTRDEVDIVQGKDSLVAILNSGTHSRKDSKPSWLVGVDFKVTDDLMVYFNQRGSWRTGGYNGTSAASFPNASTFEPETTYDFELGAKFSGHVASMPTRFNVAVYNQNIKNVQRAPYLNISALAGNVKKARVNGVELDGSISPISWLDLGGSFAYTDAKYTDAHATVAGANFLFGPYGDAPKMQGSAYLKVSNKLGEVGTLAFRAEIYGQSYFYYSNLANTIVPNARIAGYGLVNVRAEWNEINGSRVNLAAYINNVANKEYETGGFPLGAVTGSNGTNPGVPRMFGIEAGVKF
jgi:iron complex outermembrane recepter protein